MKKALLTLMCLAAMMAAGTSLKAQEVTIVLMPGWTWISIPSTDTLDFATALGSFTPEVGDLIASQWGNAVYMGNGQWRGSVSQFYPGYGYKYKSNRTVPVTVTLNAQQPNPQGDDHEYVDLGLPSGTLWATCNVGANNPEDYGDYFAWGETQPKESYDWNTYQHCNGSENTFTKYCWYSGYGYNGFTDNMTTLLPEDDAATANWGSDWRMPTEDEWIELYQHTTSTWTTQNGVYGKLFTATNNNSVFLPAGGIRVESSLNTVGSNGNYWSSSLSMGSPEYARSFCYNSYDYIGSGGAYRRSGQSIRPVRSETPTGVIRGRFTINSNGDQVFFSKGNLQYIGSASNPYWKFADNQWDYIVSFQNSSSQFVDRDLFGWGTSGYNHGANCYQPWSTSKTNSSYYAYGNPSYNLYDQTGQADWGYNPIRNGGGQESSGWRTLTIEEWDYLFNTRVTLTGIRYAKAQVNDVNGVILLPDNWNTGTFSLSNTNNPWADFSSNTITILQWVSLESTGVVFLPAAGGRNGTSVSEVGSYGNYWSASLSQNNDGVSFVSFSNDDFSDIYNCQRYHGMSVRLVCNAQ